jgi:RNA-binding protein
MALNNKLNNKQKRYLLGLAHKLKPTVMVGGAGLSEGVIKETDSTLAHHELIKVRISGIDRRERTQMSETLAAETGSELITIIGHIAILYRRAKKPHIKLPA